MSEYIESKFRLDYRNFETLPAQHAENLEILNSRIKQVEHIKKIQQEINDLELSLAAETKMVADDVLRQNVFPRFRDYSDFISQQHVYQETIENNPSFGNLAMAVQSPNFDGAFKDSNKLFQTFEYFLESFIWIFFEGYGAWTVDDMKLVVDYDHCTFYFGSDAYPSSTSYHFNATNSKNGKSYRVEFGFYDLKGAINAQYAQYMKRRFEDSYSNSLRRFESIRSAGYGQILCTIYRIGKSRHDGSIPEPDKKVCIQTFDPFEISAFIKHVVFEDKGEINEQ